MSEFIKKFRPGYFGRRRDDIVKRLNEDYGKDNWKIVWAVEGNEDLEFEAACRTYYERSYLKWFAEYPEELDFVCTFGECIDNAASNIVSGCDYTKQEAFSTHIQDIAVRNVLRLMNRRFIGPKNRILVIRSADSEGFKYGPGNIPFVKPALITAPTKCPPWAKPGSVEDFWQSNKWVAIRTAASSGQ